MAVHFKFRAEKDFSSVTIDGHFITVSNLKERIIEQKGLGNRYDVDLVITDAQTGEEYKGETDSVARNTSVIVKRVPSTRAKAILAPEEPKARPVVDSHREHDVQKAPVSKTLGPEQWENAVDVDEFGGDLYLEKPAVPGVQNEEDENAKISAMVNNATSEWQKQTQEASGGRGGRGYGRGGMGGRWQFAGRSGTPPVGYVCHRCGQPGHYIQNCPTNGDPDFNTKRVKPPSGIPRTRLQQNKEGYYILPDGSTAVMQPDESAFQQEATALLALRPAVTETPPELRCPLCNDIFKDAVIIPCCGVSFCDQCIRQELIANGKCPNCGSTKYKNDDLLPNMSLRQAIERFKESQALAGPSQASGSQQVFPSAVESSPAGGLPRQGGSHRTPPSGGSAASGSRGRGLQALGAAPAEEHSRGSGAAASAKNGGKSPTPESAPEAVPQPEGGVRPAGPPAEREVTLALAGQEDAVSEGVVGPPSARLGGQDAKGSRPIGEVDSGPAGTAVDTTGGKAPPAHNKDEIKAVVADASKEKRKKKRVRPTSEEGGFMENHRAPEPCYLCGSFEHFSPNCPTLMRGPMIPFQGPPYQRGFGPGGRPGGPGGPGGAMHPGMEFHGDRFQYGPEPGSFDMGPGGYWGPGPGPMPGPMAGPMQGGFPPFGGPGFGPVQGMYGPVPGSGPAGMHGLMGPGGGPMGSMGPGPMGPMGGPFMEGMPPHFVRPGGPVPRAYGGPHMGEMMGGGVPPPYHEVGEDPAPMSREEFLALQEGARRRKLIAEKSLLRRQKMQQLEESLPAEDAFSGDKENGGRIITRRRVAVRGILPPRPAERRARSRTPPEQVATYEQHSLALSPGRRAPTAHLPPVEDLRRRLSSRRSSPPSLALRHQSGERAPYGRSRPGRQEEEDSVDGGAERRRRRGTRGYDEGVERGVDDDRWQYQEKPDSRGLRRYTDNEDPGLPPAQVPRRRDSTRYKEGSDVEAAAEPSSKKRKSSRRDREHDEDSGQVKTKLKRSKSHKSKELESATQEPFGDETSAAGLDAKGKRSKSHKRSHKHRSSP